MVKLKIDNLPNSLKAFIEKGHTVFRSEDGDWIVKIEIPAKTPYNKSIPLNSLIIANNGCGDCLFIRQNALEQNTGSPTVFVYWHDEPRYEIYSDNINKLTNPEPPKPSIYKTIFYHGGTVEVQLGDEVSACDFLFRKNGRIYYLPGVSKKNRNMEYSGLLWVGIRFQKGTFIGSIVDPETFQLKKSVRFLQRSQENIKELSPDEDFE